MRRQVAIKERSEAYRASPEFAATERSLDAWLRSYGIEPRKHRPRPTQRMRRGKLVPIPKVWQGVVTHPQTIRKRNPVRRRTRKNKNKST